MIINMNDLDYWQKRCELSEKYIRECPCDPDITSEQLKAYQDWTNFIVKYS